MAKGKSDKSYAELIRVLGRLNAEKLCFYMSGERLCLGARVEVNLAKDISVIAAIGLNAAKQLFLETEETVLLISKRGSILARNRMAVKLLQSGYSRKQTAQAIGLTERGLSRAIAEPSDNLA